MSRIGTLLGVFGLALLMASVATAQPGGRAPGGRQPGGMGGGMMGGGGGSYLQLLRIEGVQKAIDLTAEQKTELTKLGETAGSGMRELFSGMRDLSAEEREKKMAEVRTKMEAQQAELQKKVEGILLPHQVKRLKELSIQAQGIRALQSAEVQKELGITEEQKAKMEAVRKEVADQFAKMREELQDKPEAERREAFRAMGEKMRASGQETEKKILDVLSEAQKAKFETMKGAKADFDLTPRMGGPGGAGGRGGRGGQGGGGGGANN